MIAVLCAVGAAIINAFGTVMQRRAASQLPPQDAMRLALLKHLLQRPLWYAGIGGMIGGFLLQATALNFAGLALVQPILAVELPITLLFGARVFHAHVDREAFIGMVTLSGGLALLIVSLNPDGGQQPSTIWLWIWAWVVSVVAGAGLVLAGMATKDGVRAALFGSASGLAFGFTAALMKGALDRLPDGLAALVTSWQLYAMVMIGLIAVYLTQNAFHSGPLVAAQPAITTCEPLTSILYGVLLFHEQLRAGIWIIPALTGAGLLGLGSVLLSRSPLSRAGTGAEETTASQTSHHDNTDWKVAGKQMRRSATLRDFPHRH